MIIKLSGLSNHRVKQKIKQLLTFQLHFLAIFRLLFPPAYDILNEVWLVVGVSKKPISIRQSEEIFICRCVGIGRRDGLKIRWWQHRVGSTPTTGTKKKVRMSAESPVCMRTFAILSRLIWWTLLCLNILNNGLYNGLFETYATRNATRNRGKMSRLEATF